MKFWQSLSPRARAIITIVATILQYPLGVYLVLGGFVWFDSSNGISTDEVAAVWYPAGYIWLAGCAISAAICVVRGTVLAVRGIRKWYDDLYAEYSKTTPKENT